MIMYTSLSVPRVASESRCTVEGPRLEFYGQCNCVLRSSALLIHGQAMLRQVMLDT